MISHQQIEQDIKNCETGYPHLGKIPYPECGPGWWPVLSQLIELIGQQSDRRGFRIEITQIKEKFGGLRFYFHVDPESADHATARAFVDGAIDMAEQMILKTCILCGDRATPKARMCDPCDALQKVHGA